VRRALRRAAVSLVVGLVFGLALAPGRAHADAVDDAFVAGNEAAARSDWKAAAASYEAASALLRGRNATLSYNLGTAYAELGELGRAAYHLTRATDFRGGPTTDVLDAARENLEVVRKRIELRATTEGTVVDRAATSWDLIRDALRARSLGWLSLLSGVGFLFGGAVTLRRQRRGLPARGVLSASLGVLAFLYLVPGLLHGWALKADREAPEAIVLPLAIDAREGPGPHRSVAFQLQGGSRIRIVEESLGWSLIRLPGGIEGWVPADAVGRLEASQSAPPVRS